MIDALESEQIDSDLNGDADEQDPQSGPQLSCGRFRPFAVAADGTEESRLEVRVAGAAAADSVSVFASSKTPPALDGAVLAPGIIEIELYDDGSHGDRTAGDEIWTRGHFTYKSDVAPGAYTMPFSLWYIRVRTGPATWTRHFYDINRPTYEFDVQLVPINPADIEEPAQVAAGFQATSHVVNLVNGQQALELARSQDNVAELSRIFYGSYGDNYDFLLMVPEAETFTGPAGEHTVVQNEAFNVGQRVWNGAQGYGSAGRLKGISFIDFAVMPGGPKLHELMHQWAVPDLAKLNIGQCTVQHWGVMGQQGQLGGFDSATLVAEGAGRYSADSFWVYGNSNVPYSPIELYLAGFLPAEEVPPIVVPRSVQCSSLAYSADRTRVSFQASGLDTVTIDQIVSQLHGPRVPGYAEAQKNFKAAMIAVSARAAGPGRVGVLCDRRPTAGRRRRQRRRAVLRPSHRWARHPGHPGWQTAWRAG